LSGLRRRLDAGLGAGLALLMAVAVANVVWQVVSRFVLGSPSSFTDELARSLLIWIGLLGAAFGVGRGLHVAVDLLPRGLARRSQLLLEALVSVAVLAFAVAVLGLGGLGLVWLSFELGQTTAVLRLPLGLIYLALPLSGAVVGVYAGDDLRRSVSALLGEGER